VNSTKNGWYHFVDTSVLRLLKATNLLIHVKMVITLRPRFSGMLNILHYLRNNCTNFYSYVGLSNYLSHLYNLCRYKLEMDVSYDDDKTVFVVWDREVTQMLGWVFPVRNFA
jgi:hypothetical protein